MARLVSNFDADHAEAAFAERAGLGAEYLYLDGGRLSWLEVSQLTDAEVAVAAGDVEEEVADGADAGFSRGLGGLWTDALQGSQTLLEDARAGPEDWRVE